jgi:RES domain-containing protein
MPKSTDKKREAALDEAIEESFPASDPPSQTQAVTATPTQSQVPLRDTGKTGDEVHVYRVIEPRQASEPFSGRGADRGGRWTSPGTQGVYASLTPASAMLEYLVHLEGDTPSELLMAQGTMPVASVLAQVDLPSDWKQRPYRDTVRQIGDKWANAQSSLALRVPSAVCEEECNIVINPAHPDFTKLRVEHLVPLKIDPRLRI